MSGSQLLENSIATGAGLVALILALGPVSGAHFNPIVTMADRILGGTSHRDAGVYVVVQVAGACVGAMVANLMFDLPAIDVSTNTRSSSGLWLGEAVAAFGLLLVILGVVRAGRASVAAFAVGGYIAAAYWFTSSTSFANPAVTIGRMLSNTFAGIAPSSVPMFIVMQVLGALLAVALGLFLFPDIPATDLVVPHESPEDTHDRPPAHRRPAARTQIRGRDGSPSSSTACSGPRPSNGSSTSSYDQFAGRATATNFLPVMAERFARQRLQGARTRRGQGPRRAARRFSSSACTMPGRSQMALGWFNHLAGDRAVAWSGGSEPGNEVNPAAIAAMAEIGIDIATEFPKPWTDEIVQAADVVVTMGCGDACPLFPGKRYEDWELEDPAGQGVDAVRPIRDEIGDACPRAPARAGRRVG